jgi:hypothetical protein
MNKMNVLTVTFVSTTIIMSLITLLMYGVELPKQVPCERIDIETYNQTKCYWGHSCKNIDICTDIDCDNLTQVGSGQCCENDKTICNYKCINIIQYTIHVEISHNRTGSLITSNLESVIPITCWVDYYGIVEISCKIRKFEIIKRVFLGLTISLLIISLTIILVHIALCTKKYQGGDVDYN